MAADETAREAAARAPKADARCVTGAHLKTDMPPTGARRQRHGGRMHSAILHRRAAQSAEDSQLELLRCPPRAQACSLELPG